MAYSSAAAAVTQSFMLGKLYENFEADCLHRKAHEKTLSFIIVSKRSIVSLMDWCSTNSSIWRRISARDYMAVDTPKICLYLVILLDVLISSLDIIVAYLRKIESFSTRQWKNCPNWLWIALILSHLTWLGYLKLNSYFRTSEFYGSNRTSERPWQPKEQTRIRRSPFDFRCSCLDMSGQVVFLQDIWLYNVALFSKTVVLLPWKMTCQNEMEVKHFSMKRICHHAAAMLLWFETKKPKKWKEKCQSAWAACFLSHHRLSVILFFERKLPIMRAAITYCILFVYWLT